MEGTVEDALTGFDPARDSDGCTFLPESSEGRSVASRPAIALPRPVRFLDGYSNLSQATAWSVGEHWPTARDADVSFAAAARLMNVVGGKTRDAAMVKRLRSEGKIFAVHCGDYYPNRKDAEKREDPILAEVFDATRHTDFLRAKSDYLAEKWARPFVNELDGALPGGFDAIVIDEGNSEDRDGTVSAKLFVEALRKLRVRIGNRLVLVYSTASVAASGRAIPPYNPGAAAYSQVLWAIDNFADLYLVEVYVKDTKAVPLSTFDALASNLAVRRPALMQKTVFALGIGWDYLRYPCGYRPGETMTYPHGTPGCAPAMTMFQDELTAIRAGAASRRLSATGIGLYTFYQSDAATVAATSALVKRYYP